MSIGFFADTGLSQPAARLSALADADGTGYSDHVFYLGNTTTGREYVAASDPGVDEITVSVTDSLNGASLLPSCIKRAATSGGLGSATPGAALDVGTSIAGLAYVEIYVRVDIPVTTAAIYDNIGLTTNDMITREIA